MGKRQPASDEILEHLSETIEEMTCQIDGQASDRMVDIDEDTPLTIPLTPRIEERYTAMHYIYFSETVDEQTIDT